MSMKEPFQVIKIDANIYQVTWQGEYVFFVHKSKVWNNAWKAFSKKNALKDDIDNDREVLIARLKVQCEKAIAV